MTRLIQTPVIALKEIRLAQKGTDLLIPRHAFSLVVRELALQRKKNLRFQSGALQALQEAAEA